MLAHLHPVIVRLESFEGPDAAGALERPKARAPMRRGPLAQCGGETADIFSATKRAGTMGRVPLASLSWGNPWFPHGPPPFPRARAAEAGGAGAAIDAASALCVSEPPAGQSPAPAADRSRFPAIQAIRSNADLSLGSSVVGTDGNRSTARAGRPRSGRPLFHSWITRPSMPPATVTTSPVTWPEISSEARTMT
jgi:hypothetical protein